jgi:hypothetical protein
MNSTPYSKHIRLTKKFVHQSLADSQAWINSSKFYDSDTLFRVLLHASLDKTSVEDICRSSNRLPSPDTVMAQLASTHCQSSRDLLEQQISELFQTQVGKHNMFKGYKPPKVILAIDLHDEEYYGEHLFFDEKRFTTFSTTKGRNALRYGTLSIVSANGKWNYPLTLGFVCNYVGQPRQEVLKRLLSQINLPMKIDCLLMDGGFNDANLFEWLDQKNISFLVRGRYSSKKTYLGPLWSTFDYTTGAKKYPVRAFLFPRMGKNGKTQEILLLSNHDYSLKKAISIYKIRFRIENTYRQSKLVKIRTSTTKIRLRWIMWAFAHFLELVWELSRFIALFLDLDQYEIRQKQFIRWIRDHWLRLTAQPIR